MKLYTERGKTWELANSWWILLMLLPFGMTSFAGFMYAGSKVKNQRWRIYGFIYLAIFVVAFIIANIDISTAIAFSLWVVTVIHAFKIRPAYLVQLDVLKANEKKIDNEKITKLRQEAEAKFSVNEKINTKTPQPKVSTEKVRTNAHVEEEQFIEKIDINTASEADIAKIPAIGIILAKKVILKRQEIGRFQSFEQFSYLMELKEHTIEKIKQCVTFSFEHNSNNQNSQSKSGRVIDF